MSYDLMVFNPNTTPTNTRKEFMEWYGEQTKWDEGHKYDNSKATTPELRNWYQDMLEKFPAMNGPDAVSDDEADNPNVSDYSVGKDMIYVTFAWSVSEEAYTHFRSIAEKHKVGFFDVSADDGEIVDFSKPQIKKKFWEFWK